MANPGLDNSPIKRVVLTDADGNPVYENATGPSADQVQGTAADNDAAVGNPVLVGGYYESGTDTYADGDVAKLHMDVNGNALVSQATLQAGEDLTNGVTKVEQRASYTNISADTLIKTGAGRLFGFIVNSHTVGTLKLWDNTSAATTVLLNTITFAAGPNFVMFPVAVDFNVGLYADIGGTIDLTIFWK